MRVYFSSKGLVRRKAGCTIYPGGSRLSWNSSLTAVPICATRAAGMRVLVGFTGTATVPAADQLTFAEGVA